MLTKLEKAYVYSWGVIKSQRVALEQMMKRNCLALAVENFMEKNPSNTGHTGFHVIYAVYGHVCKCCLPDDFDMSKEHHCIECQ